MKAPHVATPGLLVLVDMDGTLLLTHDEVYGTAPNGPDRPGETALSHTRRALRSAGVSEPEIEAGLEQWCTTFSARYEALLAGADTRHWEVAPRAAGTLARIERRALLTGNPEPVARARIDRIGLAALFPNGQGAFGCEREDRVGLFELARHRAGDWPAERTVGVGDTPVDVSSAHDAGALSVAVTSGVYSAVQLASADAVVKTFAEVPAALAALAPANEQ